MREHIWKNRDGMEVRATDLPASALTGSPVEMRIPSQEGVPFTLPPSLPSPPGSWVRCDNLHAVALEILRLAEENRVLKAMDKAVEEHLPVWEAEQLEAVRVAQENEREARAESRRAIEKRDRWRQECEKHVAEIVGLREDVKQAEEQYTTARAGVENFRQSNYHLEAHVLELTQERDVLERSLKLADATAVERIAYLSGNALATDREHSRLSAEISMLRELNATQAETIRAMAAKIREMGLVVVSFLADNPQYVEIPGIRAIVESEEPLCLCGHAQGCHATTFSECWNCGCEGFQPDLGGADCSGGTGGVRFADHVAETPITEENGFRPSLSHLSARQIWEAMTESQRCILGVGNRGVSLADWERKDHQ